MRARSRRAWPVAVPGDLPLPWLRPPLGTMLGVRKPFEWGLRGAGQRLEGAGSGLSTHRGHGVPPPYQSLLYSPGICPTHFSAAQCPRGAAGTQGPRSCAGLGSVDCPGVPRWGPYPWALLTSLLPGERRLGGLRGAEGWVTRSACTSWHGGALGCLGRGCLRVGGFQAMGLLMGSH